MIEEADVVVVGSGGAGMVAALRSAAQGLRAVVIEKARAYGGTTAVSGGSVWIPTHHLPGLNDSRSEALTYLRHVTAGEVGDDKLEAYVDNAKDMVDFLEQERIRFVTLPAFPDYFPEAPGSTPGRSIHPDEFNGEEIGDDYYLMRSPDPALLLLGRYSMDLAKSLKIAGRALGWQLVAAKVILKYWLDRPGRRHGSRDRRATRGDYLVGSLRRQLKYWDVPVLLNTSLEKIHMSDGRVASLTVSTDGVRREINALRAVVLAAGGYEQSQAMRDQHLPVQTRVSWSLTPPGANTGDALDAAVAIGADTNFMEGVWWCPVMQLPSREMPNLDVSYGLYFDQRHPHSLIVNRNGVRFANEGLSYDRFGIAMVEDQRKGGATIPCWMVFDTSYRAKFTCGPILPNSVQPDHKIPADWWDRYVYRAASVRELAGKINVPAEALEQSVFRMNGFAKTGIDADYGRGESAFDRFWGDPRVAPNPSIGPIDNPPYYAIPVYLGDLGTKGGLRTDARGRVLDRAGDPIPGLYAAGNNAASPFGNAYPGGGGTLGAALTFGFVAANHIALTN